jgi:hypothetical protein
MTVGHGNELVKDLGLVLLGREPVALAQSCEEFRSGLLADRVVQGVPLRTKRGREFAKTGKNELTALTTTS